MSNSGSTEGFAFKGLENVQENIDFRLSKVSRPRTQQLDQNLSCQLGGFISHEGNHQEDDKKKQPPVEPEPIYVSSLRQFPDVNSLEAQIEFKKGDERNPVNYSNFLKWVITLVGCAFSVLAASTSASYNMGFPSMMTDLNCSEFQATIGLSVYALGFAVVPLVSSSLSEELGRRPLYIGSLIGHILMHLMVALSKNIQTVIVARLLAGGFGSTGAVMVGGTIADIWRPHERSLPMSIYSLAAVGGTGLGPAVAGWVELNPRLQWRWIQWIHMILTGAVLLLVIVLMKETRSTIILTRLARKLRKETGDKRYRARAEDEEGSLSTLILISCTRPVYLLTTEPTVLSISVWLGFAWGILYCILESNGSIFKALHEFDQGQIGLTFLGLTIGSFIGFLTNIYQEMLYRKHFPTRGPEARLYAACGMGIVFPIGMFIYAWSAFPHVPWVALVIGMTVIVSAAFTIYLAAFTYLADCYGPFASSASAGQSLLRNLFGMAFPLFSQQMFAALTYKWGNTLFALIAVFMIPTPFILFVYGPYIRSRSKFASKILEQKDS
ncbi:hypothetical protein PILCRDRAFT_62793 [Piloderma croceum F 1598]|uniref:Major facilitator superfamily (MFS) profile domain-containing protein n=1 Tax=Piloderma croceum (strain F 1598) TaxID=765440 RepID=A0A0C3GBV2_PILCF|nr:hypothetical protein PILCRDRAFT_62793 [Piloderma croceum F 1598]